LLGVLSPIAMRPVFRPHENRWLDAIVTRRRGVFLGPAIARDNIREVIRALRQREVVWFASDQNYGLKHSVFSPFFGIPAATNTALTRLVALTGAAVLPFASRRLPDGTYDLVIHPPLENFPSLDAQDDMNRVNKLIETEVRLAPEQYWWIHRRFKDRPPGQKDVYARADRTP
jgi:KDO2-lipid IV(A) lauroyltransferase